VKEGFLYAKKIMTSLAEEGIALADEAVYPRNAKGFIDLLSWIAIGARSTENQEHRVFASNIDLPVGIKNPTSGSIQIGVNGVIAAQNPQIYFEENKQTITKGNKYAHLVLRGGYLGPNYQTPHLLEAESLLLAGKIKNPSVIVDLSHDNSVVDGEKNPHAQSVSAYSVVDSLKNWPHLRKTIKGFMLESFIKTGCQDPGALSAKTLDYNGLSITDPCLGWEETKALILELAKALKPYAK
jgi:3-deoxy-7-phosphoheptulonate synthase